MTMSESNSHLQLVRQLIDWISDSFLGQDSGHIFADLPGSTGRNRPPTVNGYVPDVYVSPATSRCLVIGEAKTARDLDRLHTRRQLTAFLCKCAESGSSVLVLAVPWDMAPSARSLIRGLRAEVRAHEVRVVVLDQLGYSAPDERPTEATDGTTHSA